MTPTLATNPAITSSVFSQKQNAANDPMERMREKAQELEGVFLNTLMSQMFSSIDTENGFGGGYAEDTWRGMQAEQYADMIAKNGGVGLADQIMASLLHTQEAAQAASPAFTNPAKVY